MIEDSDDEPLTDIMDIYFLDDIELLENEAGAELEAYLIDDLVELSAFDQDSYMRIPKANSFGRCNFNQYVLFGNDLSGEC